MFSDSHLDFELLHKFRPTGFEIGNRLIGFASLVCMGNTGESVIRETARIRFTSQISRCTIINIYMYQNFFMSTLIADVVKLPYQVQNSQNNKLQHSRPGHTNIHFLLYVISKLKLFILGAKRPLQIGMFVMTVSSLNACHRSSELLMRREVNRGNSRRLLNEHFLFKCVRRVCLSVTPWAISASF